MRKKQITATSKVNLIDTGMSFIYRGSETTGNKALSVIIHTLFSYIITLLLSLGSLFTFITMFSIKHHEGLLLTVALLYALAMVIVLQLSKKVLRFILLGIAVLFTGVTLLSLDLVISGLDYIKDFIILGIAKSMYWSEPVLSYVFNEPMKADTTFVLTLISVLITTGVSFFVVRKINFIFVFLITFPFFEIGAAFGCVPNHIWFGTMLAGWMAVFAMHAAIAIRKIKRRKKDKKRAKISPAKQKKIFISSIGVIVAASAFAVFTFSNYMISVAGYDRPENMKTLRSDFKTYVSDLIDYIIGQDNDGSLREGRLYQMGDRIIKNRRYLTVEAPLRTQTYLRGYIGTEYTGNSWETPKIEKWMEESYKSSGYYPQSLQGKALKELSNVNVFVESSAATVTISNLRRKKDYAYTTYVPYLSNDFTLSGDYMIEPNNKSTYSYNAFVDTGNLFMLNNSNMFDNREFSSVWKEYSVYAKEEYTKYPSGMAEINNAVDALKNGTGYGYEEKGPAQSSLEIADRIRAYLETNIEYSLTTPKMPEDSDFLNWLLTENKKGYSAHYATAMAIMLRMAGVPTRYVEGYLLTEEDFAKSTPLEGGYYSMDVTDQNAHAWVEIYESNYGWIPVEATPGFYEGNLTDDVNTSELDEIKVEQQEEELAGNQTEITIPVQNKPELPELKLKDEEEPVKSSLQSIFKAIKYMFISVGIAVIAFISILIVGFIVLVIRRAVRLTKLNRSIFKGSTEESIVAIYKYYKKLLIFEGMNPKEQIPYMEFTDKICNSCKILNGEKHKSSMLIFLKYRFSNEEITENELNYLKDFITEYRKRSLKAVSGEEKFKFMFIDNLG